MKLVLIGATGEAGSRLLKEALLRGHTVTALVRNPTKLSAQKGLTITKGDIGNVAETAKAFSGQDAVIAAFNPPRGAGDFADQVKKGYQSIVQAAEKAGVKRFVMVGGAGSLDVAPGVPLVTTPNFPAEYKVEAEAMFNVWKWIRENRTLDWTVISPSAFFAPGERSGRFRVGTDQLLADEKGNSRISMEDFAIALVDELEKPAHIRQRFTVGY